MRAMNIKSELQWVLKECWPVIAGAVAFSVIVNLLMLVGSFYMLEVYDRVLPSKSIPTLVVLSIAAFALYSMQGFFDFYRGRILIRIGNHFDERLNRRIFNLMSRTVQINRAGPDASQAQSYLDAIKNFFSSGGPIAFIDLPWIPVFVCIMFLFHWMLGVAALLCGIILVALTIYAEYRSRQPVRELGGKLAAKGRFVSTLNRNAEVVASMGLQVTLADLYRAQSQSIRTTQTALSDTGSGLGGISRTLRLIMQSGILGVGALLVIWGEASAGVIIAGSILFGRALAPVDQAISNWRGFMSARDAWMKLDDLLKAYPEEDTKLSLPAPTSSVRAEGLSFVDARSQRFILRDVSFALKPGDALCIIGPSGAGKSTLLRLLVHVWLPSAGRVMLDNASLDQWSMEDRGRHIGFVPQDVELFSGSIAQNIARFQPDFDSEKVLEAAKQAGIHDLVLSLKDGYQTQVGENGAALSAGQRQRLALARALYHSPFLVVLDEPNSNLDADGDIALANAVREIRKRGGIVIAVSHRPSLLEAFDSVLLLREGRVIGCGPKEEILQKYLVKPAPAANVRTLAPAEASS